RVTGSSVVVARAVSCRGPSVLRVRNGVGCFVRARARSRARGAASEVLMLVSGTGVSRFARAAHFRPRAAPPLQLVLGHLAKIATAARRIRRSRARWQTKGATLAASARAGARLRR